MIHVSCVRSLSTAASCSAISAWIAMFATSGLALSIPKYPGALLAGEDGPRAHDSGVMIYAASSLLVQLGRHQGVL
jgi:hypothetical protein